MSFWEKMIDKRIAAYQSGLLATHYAEVENMYRRMRGWRHDYATIFRCSKATRIWVRLTISGGIRTSWKPI